MTWARLLVLLVVAIAGLQHAAYPFGGDQALFTVGAQKLHHGAVLYRDFWDLKQPGIYVFYLTAGVLFGFSSAGVHLFELLYFMAFAAVLQISLIPYYRLRWIPIAAPLLIIATYYANAGSDAMTQVEPLAGFPLFASLALVLAGCRDGRRRIAYFAAAGIIGAWVLCLKLMFLPLVLAIWICAIWIYASQFSGAERQKLLAHTAVLAVSFAAGTASWIAATAAASGQSLVWKTFISDPMQIARRLPPPPIQRLIHSVRLYVQLWIGTLLLTVVGLRYNRGIAKNPLAVCCIVWIAAGAAVILLQRQSWWPYHLQLLDVPFALLAAFGLEALWGARPLVFAAGVVVVAAIPFVRSVAPVLYTPSSAYDPSIAETRMLTDPGAVAGDIYVCGDPRFYLASKRGQAVAINGWGLELLLPDEWLKLDRELASARPPYIFVSTFYGRIIRTRSQQVSRTLNLLYRPVHSDATGTWYERV
jgi:hypothetical protein